MTKSITLEKTFTIFHARDAILQQQYREKNFMKFFELISCLFVVEQNNKLLMQNHQSRRSGLGPLLDTNCGKKRWHDRGNGYKNHDGRGYYGSRVRRGRGRNQNYF